MGLVNAYHTESDDPPRYHEYDDCPDGARVLRDGNATPGAHGKLCEHCERKRMTGRF